MGSTGMSAIALAMQTEQEFLDYVRTWQKSAPLSPVDEAPPHVDAEVRAEPCSRRRPTRRGGGSASASRSPSFQREVRQEVESSSGPLPSRKHHRTLSMVIQR